MYQFHPSWRSVITIIPPSSSHLISDFLSWQKNPFSNLGLVAQSCLTLCDPMDYTLPGSSVHRNSPGKNTGVDCHALLQGIFPTQGPNPGLLHCWQILLPSKPPGKPKMKNNMTARSGGKDSEIYFPLLRRRKNKKRSSALIDNSEFL